MKRLSVLRPRHPIRNHPAVMDLAANSRSRFELLATAFSIVSTLCTAGLGAYSASIIFSGTRVQPLATIGVGSSVLLLHLALFYFQHVSRWHRRGMRLWMVGVSLAVTTMLVVVNVPLLSLIIFADEIKAEVQRQRHAELDEAIFQVRKSYDPELDRLEEQIYRVQERAIAELAGTSGSGIVGAGPVYREYNRQRYSLLERRDGLIEDRDSALEAASRRVLAEPSGTSLIGQFHILSRIQDGAHRFVQALLGIILFLLYSAPLLLTLLSTRVGRGSDSWWLTYEYSRYRRGVFDVQLPNDLRSTGRSRMTEEEFANWYAVQGGSGELESPEERDLHAITTSVQREYQTLIKRGVARFPDRKAL